MKRPASPLFLEREGYRRRRIMDAARMLPILGALMFMLPLLWAPQASPAEDTVRGMVFLFAVWAGLIAGTWLLARRLAPRDPPAPPPAADPSRGEAGEGG